MVFCAEFHVGVGQQTIKRIKRHRGEKFKPSNVQRRKNYTKKAEKELAREKKFLKMLHVFSAVGYNYKQYIFYTVPNRVGKMTTECFTERFHQ